MEDNFNKHLGNKLKLRRLALGLTQTKVAKAINVTFQQIQKYEKGTNGVSSIRLLQLSNYLKVITLEAQTLARACGKSHLRNLEPEDLCALTVESAAMARVPLAGTSWIPGS